MNKIIIATLFAALLSGIDLTASAGQMPTESSATVSAHTSDDWNARLNKYENLTNEYIKEYEKAHNGDTKAQKRCDAIEAELGSIQEGILDLDFDSRDFRRYKMINEKRDKAIEKIDRSKPKPQAKPKPASPRVTFTSASLRENATHNGKKCVEIHAKFKATKMKGKKIKVVAYLYTPDGKLSYKGKTNNANDSQYSCSATTPVVSSDNATWNDFVMYLPYDNLKSSIGDNKYSIKLVAYNGGTKIGSYDGLKFGYWKKRAPATYHIERSEESEVESGTASGSTGDF